MSRANLNDAKHWRDRAAELRVLSDEMRSADTTRMMCNLADDYDTMADRAEERDKNDDFGPMPSPKKTN